MKNAIAPDVRALTPGIRLAGQDSGDQTRIATPGSAIKDGSSWLVIGRAVSASNNPRESTQNVYDQVAQSISIS